MTSASATSASAAADDPEATRPEPVPLLAPVAGVPEVVTSPPGLAEAAGQLASGHGPVAVDAERASGYRYGQRAYLLQLRRAGAGTVLVDPVAVPDLSGLRPVLDEVEWVLHAASQDLPCLRELDLAPPRLFDTELAGRLLGFPRVGLAALVAQELGVQLAKEHSAVDWSRRPLPAPWLTYAALDVEVLLELRDALEDHLARAGKLEWAHQEFDAVRAAPAPGPRTDPWRRLSGLHKVRSPRRLAVARQLWLARDQVARSRDTAPGRVLPDAAIATVAADPAVGAAQVAGLPAFAGRGARRHLPAWERAVATALELPDSALPPVSAPADGPPPPRSWPDRDPAAAARLAAVRAGVAAVAAEVEMPSENVLAPDAVKRISWRPPAALDPQTVAATLSELGARPWQVELTTAAVLTGLQA